MSIGSRSLMEGLCMLCSKKASLDSNSSSASCWERLVRGGGGGGGGGGTITKTLILKATSESHCRLTLYSYYDTVVCTNVQVASKW